MTEELLNKVIAMYNSKGYTDITIMEDCLIIRRGAGWMRIEGFAGIIANRDFITNYDTARKD